MRQIVPDNLQVKLPGEVGAKFSDAEISNLMLHKALNKMDYFRTRCVEMEEKYGLDFKGFKEKIINGDEDLFAEWDELALWQEYFNSFEEWKQKYEELNRYLS